MPSTLDLCEKLYGTRDVYALSTARWTKRPRRVRSRRRTTNFRRRSTRIGSRKRKNKATEKFKVLIKIHAILSDAPKRALYNEKGIIDDNDEELLVANWLAMWQQFFNPITTGDITNFEKEYIDSELERNDIRKAYLDDKGCINHMMNSVPFMNCEDEPRIAVIVKEMIAAEEVSEFKIFTEEPKARRDRRHKKYAKEAREAKAIKEKLEKKENEKRQSAGTTSLEQQIALRQADRRAGFASLLDKLAKNTVTGMTTRKRSTLSSMWPRRSPRRRKRSAEMMPAVEKAMQRCFAMQQENSKTIAETMISRKDCTSTLN